MDGRCCEPGTFVLSLDTELAWGGVDRPMSKRRREEYLRTRDLVASLLQLMERYDLRATWAVVGHLFLERCADDEGGKHPGVKRPEYSWYDQDWFANDPGTDASKDPVWYAPDMVRQIMACPVPQEIGSHGFSHMIVGDPGCSSEAFESELGAFVDAVKPFGVTARSFVFPRNSVGHLDLLAEHGYTTYRGTAPAWYAGLPGKLRKLGRGAEAVLPTTPPTVWPEFGGGLCNIPASYNYLHRSGWARLVPMKVRVSKAKKGLHRAAAEGSTFHMWFHPFNLASDPKNLLRGLDDIFREVQVLRESGLLVNRTMGEFAARASEELGVKSKGVHPNLPLRGKGL